MAKKKSRELRQSVAIGNRTYKPGEEDELEEVMTPEQYESLKAAGVFTAEGDELEPQGTEDANGAGDGFRGTTKVEPGATEARGAARAGALSADSADSDLSKVKIADLEARVASMNAEQVLAAKATDQRAGANKIYDARLEELGAE
jgi:hypothetical protein